jgi:exosortase/archaeosortase family protein
MLEKAKSIANGYFLPFLIFLFFLDSAIWVIHFWFGSDRNMVGLIIFLGFIYSLAKNKKLFLLCSQVPDKKPTFLILTVFFVLELLNKLFVGINIISAILFFLSIASYLIIGTAKQSRPKTILVTSLLGLSLPLNYYANIVLGYFIRRLYAVSIVWLLSFTSYMSLLQDTTIITQTRFINIDSGCSGISTTYLLLCLGIFLATLTPKFNLRRFFRNTFLSIMIYLLLNFFQIFGLVIANNILLLENVDLSHSIVKTIITVFSIAILYLLSNHRNETTNG